MPTDLSKKETLQQRIDKVISENQAIVETLDPLWTRKYMRQSSKDNNEDKTRSNRRYSLTGSSSAFKSEPQVSTAISDSPAHLVSLPKNVTLEAQTQPLELNKRIEVAHQQPPVMVFRQQSMSQAPQSVKDVWINSCKKSGVKPGNIAHLEDIASTLEGNPFHPSNPEKSMIKELLLKSQGIGVTTKDNGENRSNGPCVIEIRSSTSSQARDLSKPTHIIYADPNAKVTTTAGYLVKCNRCSNVIRSEDAETHSATQCRAKAPDPEVIPLKRPRLEDPPANARHLAGGLVRSVELPKPIQPGLLQIAQPGLQSGGGVLALPTTVAETPSNHTPIQNLIPSTPFSIPGIPTPSLSGVLTGIKSTPLFSLPGQRTAKETPIPFVLGMPGPYSQPSGSTSISMTATPAKSPITTKAPPLVPHITVSIAKEEESSRRPVPAEDAKFLRPASLALTPGSFKQKKHVMLTSGATLVSPETPRPRKSYVLTYQNGTAYTHLGMKCSTRVYYCSVFKQQPMYVLHKPKLSMYSNWKVVDKDSNQSGLTPLESLRR